MRVISGNCKGRKLKSVPGKSTRPTTDKMKETIFNWIGPYFSGGSCLDLYAGSGGIGLEALSRGMDFAIFVDNNKQAIHTIKTNVSICGMDDKCEIYNNDSERALRAIDKRKLQFDLIFLDPPYKRQKLESLLEMIEKKSLLKQSGCIICEHDPEVALPETIGGLEQVKSASYGMSSLAMYIHEKKRGSTDDEHRSMPGKL
ncbi:16S rRNA (guanine(966)-N(2))-methyltransferase RsmD [Siminovitchia fortis]|uniref:16S rRNA (Guanine(966)-N(2))-methyltransferase RsmD n=1 Tax=Siminovitchia fortis TaxID=254758 RepID=A0A443IQ47_9BACI|nr:16S rRNA (guanine(966)-N(2))-methyltransferase RsmD [Siminovitchia fortis]RWR08212.1 16S rRNA (guanine(966)-N(2))-methyltransferase RsmD [Siminovitchia fortis]WHY83411.1 16S rRNA (guanine(966)-N(2))-methyltransferase RsmD [Siminovitchia fortis]